MYIKLGITDWGLRIGYCRSVTGNCRLVIRDCGYGCDVVFAIPFTKRYCSLILNFYNYVLAYVSVYFLRLNSTESGIAGWYKSPFVSIGISLGCGSLANGKISKLSTTAASAYLTVFIPMRLPVNENTKTLVFVWKILLSFLLNWWANLGLVDFWFG